MSFQMVLLHADVVSCMNYRFGTMSFQMVLLLVSERWYATSGFGTMSFQMVLLPVAARIPDEWWFWNYVIPDGSTTVS